MDEFPLEVVEKVLAKLDIEDRATMMNIRQLNHMWKSGMDTIMEQKCLSTWTRWKPSRYCNYFPSKLFKWLRIYVQDQTVYTSVPETEMLQNGSGGNAFPTKAIYGYQGSTKDNWEMITAETFFGERGHGQFITNFKTHIKLPPKAMHSLLSLLPNLKGAGLPLELKAGEESFIKANALPSLPKLKYLELWNHDAKNKYRDYFRWFLIAYQAQLVSLKLVGEEMVPLRLKQGEGEETRPPMLQNLKVLKVYNPGAIFFKKTEATMPLTHLTIEQFEKPISLKGLKVITDFVDKFAPTLVKLSLDFTLGDVSGMSNGPWPEVSYRKLTTFTVNFPSSSNEALIIKSAFLRRFKKLVNLDFTHYQSNMLGLMRALGINPMNNRESSLRHYFGKELYYVNSSPTLSFISITAREEGEEEERILIKLPWNNMRR